MAEDDSERAEDGVHRLVDMVVEEVSLVDRAANQRRFLLVKRSIEMADEGGAGTELPGDSGAGVGGTTSPEAVAATIEALTALTELVASAAEKAFPPSTKPGKPGGSEEDKEEEDDEEDPAEAETRRKASESAAALVSQVKAALARLQAAIAAPTTKRTPAADPVLAKLEAISGSLAKIETQLKDQDGRLGKVEKNVGLPASRATEGKGKDGGGEADVSWPMDLNAPMDRASVDKSISFHDDNHA